MIRNALLITIFVVAGVAAQAQPGAKPSPSPVSPSVQTRPSTPFELSEYGVQLQPDARLIVMMAALDAAGFDPTPSGKEPSAFRRLVRKDQENLDPALRERMKNFFQRNILPAPASRP